MRRVTFFASCFALAFVLGIGIAVFFSERVQASYCDVYTDPYTYESDDPCTTPYGHHGFWVYRCNGWLFFNGHWYECECTPIQCKIPPKPPEEDPYQEP